PLHYGITEAGGSSAPIGDMLKFVGADLLGSDAAGFWVMIIVAATVFIALIGTTISCMNTGARVTYAMGKDDDSPIPSNLGILHGKTLSPYKSLWVLCIITAVFGAYGAYFSLCGSAVTDTTTAAAKAAAAIPNSLLVITYLSNFGTFALYGMTCILCIMAYSNKAEKNILKHYMIPAIGAAINFYLMYYYLNIGPEAKIAFIIAAIFAAIGLVFLTIWGKASGRGVIHRHESDLAATRIK
nr:hypothetical protein [Armatimonadota bacterium]